MPRTRVDYWTNKFNRTIARDAAAVEALEGMGWRALVLWECRLREPAYVEGALLAKTTADASAQ